MLNTTEPTTQEPELGLLKVSYLVKDFKAMRPPLILDLIPYILHSAKLNKSITEPPDAGCTIESIPATKDVGHAPEDALKLHSLSSKDNALCMGGQG